MKLTNNLAKSFCLIWVFYFAFQLTPGLVFGQIEYLAPIGGTESGLQNWLDKADGSPFVKQMGQFLEVDKKDLNATYSINTGVVTSIHLSHYFDNREDALRSFDQCIRFYEKKGCNLKTIRNEQHYQVAKGGGSGYSGSISLVKIGNRYRVDAGISTHRF